jgi:hypothetical protein
MIDQHVESNCQEYDARKFANKLSDIFLQFFMYLFGKYRDFVVGDDFDREAFIAAQASDTHGVWLFVDVLGTRPATLSSIPSINQSHQLSLLVLVVGN